MRRFLICVLCLLVIGGVGCVCAAAGPPKVLIIQSYERDLPWTVQCDQGISSVLGDSFLLEHVYLDTKKIPESEFQSRAVAALKVFRAFNPDLVMIGDDNALRLTGPAIAATGKPVVFFGINNNPRNYFKAMPHNVTGLLEGVPLFPWIRHLNGIVPGPKKVLVLLDGSPTAKALIDGNFQEKDHVLIGESSVTYTNTASWAEWKRVVLNLNSYGFITIPVFHSLKDDSGTPVSVEEVIRWTSENSSVPVFAYQDYAVGDAGVVGSYVIYGEAHGRLAARLAKFILENSGSRLPPIHSDQEGRFYFNKKQLRRFGLILPKNIEDQTVYR